MLHRNSNDRSFLWKRYGVWGHGAMWGRHSPGHVRCSRQLKFPARTAPKYKQVFEIHEIPVTFASTKAP